MQPRQKTSQRFSVPIFLRKPKESTQPGGHFFSSVGVLMLWNLTLPFDAASSQLSVMQVAEGGAPTAHWTL